MQQEVDTLKLEERLYTKVPFPELGKVPMGVAADNVAGIEYRLVQLGTTYMGLWNPTTNVPGLSDATGANGEWYRVSETADRNLGSGTITWIENNSAIHNGSIWQQSKNTASVTSVNGAIGDVVLGYEDVGAEPANENIQQHISNYGNPHNVTKAQVGLPDVPNTIAQDLADHEADVTNPHSVPLNLLIDVDVSAESTGRILGFNGPTGKWESVSNLAGFGISSYDYTFINTITPTPDPGCFHYDDYNPMNVHTLYIHKLDRFGVETTKYFAEFKVDDIFNINEVIVATDKIEFALTGIPFLVGDVWNVPVNKVSADGGGLSDGKDIRIFAKKYDTVIVDDLISTRVDQALSANMGRELEDTKSEWKGVWVNNTYAFNEWVRDGVYTGIVNNPLGTDDRLAPQDIGYAGYLFTGTLTPYQQQAKQVIFGTRYVAQTAIKLTGYRVDVIAGNEYHIYSVIDPLGTPVVNAVHSFIPDTTGWVNIAGAETIVGNGLTFDIICEVNEPAGTPTVTTLNYNYNKPNNVDITPAAGDINHANKGTDTLYINTEDDDGNDNSVFLDTLTVGDIIALDTVRWSIQSISGAGNSRTVGVSPAVQSGVNGVQPFNFESVTSTPITVGYDLDYNLTYPMSGLYIVDGKYTDIVPDDNQYGVDIEVQEISLSDDWDIVAASGNTSSSSSAAGAQTVGWTGSYSVGHGSNEKIVTIENGLIVSVN